MSELDDLREKFKPDLITFLKFEAALLSNEGEAYKALRVAEAVRALESLTRLREERDALEKKCRNFLAWHEEQGLIITKLRNKLNVAESWINPNDLSAYVKECGEETK